MNTTQKRIALLTGASLATLGVASPALAATHTGIQHATLAATGNVTDTITLCAVGSTCDYGVDNSGPGVVVSLVNSPANGDIWQTLTAVTGSAFGSIVNHGNASIDAHATATGAAANAQATLDNAVRQSVNAAQNTEICRQLHLNPVGEQQRFNFALA